MLLTSETPGFVCGFCFGSNGARALMASDRIDLPAAGEWLWLHLNLTDQRCQRWLQDSLKFGKGITAEFCQPATRQNVSGDDLCIVGNTSDFLREFDRDSTEHTWLHFICTASLLVTGRFKAAQSADRLRREISHGRNPESPVVLLGTLLSNYPDTLDATLHRLLNEIELIEDHVLEERHRGERKRLMLVRRETAQLHRHMRAFRRALNLAERTLAFLPPQLPSIISRITHLDQDFDALERRARFFHDEIDAKLAAETNRQLYILSVLTALFLPPTLVAGLFGMNVKGIPWAEASDGFWPAIALCALSSVAVSLYLWRSNKR